MDRREFLGMSAGAVGASCFGTAVAEEQEHRPRSTSQASPVSAISADRTSIQEAPRNTPVAADVDVLVVGGGPTGVGAALAAAGEGAKTLVLEAHASYRVTGTCMAMGQPI
jgi:heterodisulfide reductase subunit A-like polyferredoxin